ncbi:MAG: Holliday junction branch migration protein RuvA [Actinomycetales bacterium]|nr:Holliday junction branch migration protein RuvA [Actinomycetales bacterium]
MIASLFGTIRSLKLDQAIIDVNGVGYLVHITTKTSSHLSVGRDYQIFTSLVVREDSMTLYGFNESDERELFELVQTVSGIGPKVALAITAAMGIEDLAAAVNSKDESAIAAVPGIGKKGAQRLILELSGKLDFAHPASKVTGFSWRDQLIDALTGLGFARKQAEQAVNEIAAARDSKELSSMSPTELLKLALAHANTQKGLGK